MLVLDTDILTFLQYGEGPEYERVSTRLSASNDVITTTIVSFEEQLRGWLARCAAARTPEAYVVASQRLRGLFDYYRRHPMLDFDHHAAERLNKLRSMRLRMSTMDLRIAAIVLANNATLITRNLSDFRKVPGPQAEDWTAAG
jgi:tRNA(fMet)-specific endonuclease VapC